MMTRCSLGNRFIYPACSVGAMQFELRLILDLMEIYYPEKLERFKKFLHEFWHYQFNMFICKKELIDEYCKFAFYLLKPISDSMLDKIKEAGQTVAAVGKIEDIFCGVGMTDVIHTKGNMDGVDKTLDYMDTVSNGLIFTNLVDFDMKFGHRNDYKGYGEALELLDARIPEIISKLREDDVLMITADHGCDPTTPGTDHTREYIPLLIYGKNIKENNNLHVRDSFCDIAETILDILGVENIGTGSSMLDEIKVN
jgi:phosphopentomutase